MRKCQTLIRLLLCLTLLLNGMGSAAASAHGTSMGPHAGHGADTDEVPAGADAVVFPTCPHGPLPITSTSVDPLPAEMDCAEICLEICLQHGHALLPAVATGTWPPARPLPLVLPAAGPSSLALYPPLRPPIAG